MCFLEGAGGGGGGGDGDGDGDRGAVHLVHLWDDMADIIKKYFSLVFIL